MTNGGRKDNETVWEIIEFDESRASSGKVCDNSGRAVIVC